MQKLSPQDLALRWMPRLTDALQSFAALKPGAIHGALLGAQRVGVGRDEHRRELLQLQFEHGEVVLNPDSGDVYQLRWTEPDGTVEHRSGDWLAMLNSDALEVPAERLTLRQPAPPQPGVRDRLQGRGGEDYREMPHGKSVAEGFRGVRRPVPSNGALRSDQRLWARRQVEIWRPAVEHALAALQASPAGMETAERFGRLETALVDAGHVDAVLSLYVLLARGRLTHVLAAELDALRVRAAFGNFFQNDLEGGPSMLLRAVIREVEDPASISQRGGDCLATSVAMALASEVPEDYVRAVNGLASPKGRVQVNGAELTRSEKSLREAPGMDARSASVRVLSDAILARFESSGTDLSADDLSPHFRKKASILTTGRSRTLSELFGRTYVEVSTNGEQYEQFKRRSEVGAAALRALLEAGAPVLLGVRYEAPGADVGLTGHALLLESVADEEVSVLNPWGRQEVVPYRRLYPSLNLLWAPAEAVARLVEAQS